MNSNSFFRRFGGLIAVAVFFAATALTFNSCFSKKATRIHAQKVADSTRLADSIIRVVMEMQARDSMERAERARKYYQAKQDSARRSNEARRRIDSMLIADSLAKASQKPKQPK